MESTDRFWPTISDEPPEMDNYTYYPSPHVLANNGRDGEGTVGCVPHDLRLPELQSHEFIISSEDTQYRCRPTWHEMKRRYGR